MPVFIVCAATEATAKVIAEQLLHAPSKVKPRHSSQEKSDAFCHFLNAHGIPRRYKPWSIEVKKPRKKGDDDQAS